MPRTRRELDREINEALGGGSHKKPGGRSGSRVTGTRFSDADIERIFRSRGSTGDELKTAVLGDPAYSRRFRMRGWNKMPSMLDSVDVAIRHRDELGIPTSKHAHRLRAEHFKELRAKFDDERRRLLRQGELAHGTNGPMISGGFHEDWPETTKERIRFLAHGATALAEAEHLHEALSKTRSPAFR